MEHCGLKKFTEEKIHPAVMKEPKIVLQKMKATFTGTLRIKGQTEVLALVYPFYIYVGGCSCNRKRR